MSIDRESIYLRQLIDCNCNDCTYMVRDLDKVAKHNASYKGTGLMDKLNFGNCD